MRALAVVAITLPYAMTGFAGPCEMIDDPAGYRYLECDPAKAKAAKEAAKAVAKANEKSPRPKPGWEMTVEEFTAQMEVESSKNETERAAAKARADALRQEEDRKRADAARRRAEAAERAEADFRQAAGAGRIGAWRYAIDAEKMGGGTIKTAITQSRNEVEFGFPYQGRQRATLKLRAHPRFGRDVILAIEKGQVLCESDGCSVTLKFGSGQPQRFQAARAADHSTTMLFIRDHDRFVGNARKVDTLLIEAQFFQEGNRIFEFDVSALKWPFSGK